MPKFSTTVLWRGGPKNVVALQVVSMTVEAENAQQIEEVLKEYVNEGAEIIIKPSTVTRAVTPLSQLAREGLFWEKRNDPF